MAMTKTEQAEMARLRAEVVTAQALSWPSYGAPAMVPPPAGIADGFTVGWLMNSNRVLAGEQPNRVVERAWSTCSSHAYGEPPKPGRDVSSSRNRIPLYASRADALRALRMETTRRAAMVLAAIDNEIAQADGE